MSRFDNRAVHDMESAPAMAICEEQHKHMA